MVLNDEVKTFVMGVHGQLCTAAALSRVAAQEGESLVTNCNRIQYLITEINHIIFVPVCHFRSITS
jgi:predicted solute-binding protein